MQATHRFWPAASGAERPQTPGALRAYRHSTPGRPARLSWLAGCAALVFAVAGLAQVPTPSVLPPPNPATDGAAAPRKPQSQAQAEAQAHPPIQHLIVSDIIIQGNRNLSTEYIKNLMRTRVGKEFIPDRLQEDVRTLFSTRQFGNVYADKEEDGKGGVRIIIKVVDYPSVLKSVTYQGNISLKNDELNEITGVRVGMPCNTIAHKVACRKIMQRYAEEGRPYAFCELLKGGEPGDTEVIFSITEGPKVRIRAIEFQGNTFVSGPVLKTHMQSSTMFLGLRVGGTYNAAMLDHDINELIKYYRGFGYHDVRISRDLVPSPDGRDVTVVLHIHEGVRYRVADSPRVEGVKSMPRETFEAMGKMKAGQYYDQATVDGDTNRIRDWLGVTGRQAAVTAVPVYSKDDPGLVQLRYEVEERPPARVGQIFIVGNERTRQNVILRQVPLYPGQVLSFPALRESERNLARLNIFEVSPDGGVRPTVKVLDNPMDPDSPYKDVLVTVNETSTGSLMFGLGVNSDSGLTGSIVLNERNFDLFKVPTSFDDFLNGTAFRGAGQEFRVEAVPGTQLQRYVVSLREPFLFDTPYSLLVSGYFYQRYFNEYAEDREGGRFTIGRKVSDYWSILGTVRLENVQAYNIATFAPPDYQQVKGSNLLAGFRLGATRDTRDSLLRPTEGSLLDLGFEYVTGDFNFPLFNIDYSQYWTVYQRADGSGRHTISMHNQFGWAGSTTPVIERYFMGGFRSLRGFQFRGVSPDIDGFKVGGDFLLGNSLEYQVPVRANDQISLVAFVDSGTVATRIDQIDNYRVSVGFGIRFVVPMLGPVPIALDFGFPIVSGPHDQQQVFNFFMGWQR
jgi:outer membrane protein assembly complex protein YaeT